MKTSIYKNQVAEETAEEGTSWMTLIMEYLVSSILPADKKLARKIRVKAPNYRIIDGILYKRSFLTPWLRCVGLKQAKSTIKEIHGGSCGFHARPRSLVAKITTLGYYWPSMHMDSVEAIQSCDPHLGTEAVMLIEISIPTKRTKRVDPTQNKKDLKINLEILEERREIAAIREAAYKKKLKRYYNKKVRPSTYKPGDYVLRLNSSSKAEYTGKMGLTWEGPNKVLEAGGTGAYVLSNLKGRVIPRTWNRVNLQKYYM
ncbi:hypothetical protein Tco_1104910 [Tanacetum coccineum]